MTFKSLLLLIVGGVLANNYALEKFLGAAQVIGRAEKRKGLARLGLSVAVVIFLTAAVVWPVQTYLLAPNSLGFLQLMVFAAVVLVITALTESCLKKICKEPLGAFFPVIAVNSAVLGAAVSSVSSGTGYLEALFSAAGIGLGFAAALLLMAGVEEKIEEQYVPKAFQGLPVRLLAAAILSMALVAFK